MAHNKIIAGSNPNISATWERAAEKSDKTSGEVRVRNGKHGQEEVYVTNRSWNGKAVSAVRKKFAHASRDTKRTAAADKFHSFLSNKVGRHHAQQILSDVGIARGGKLSNRQVSSALDRADRLSESKPRTMETDHLVAGLKSNIGKIGEILSDPKAYLHATKTEYAERTNIKAIAKDYDRLKEFTIGKHVDRVLDNYVSHFAEGHSKLTNGAMTAAIVAKNIGKKLAENDLNNPYAGPLLAKTFMSAHKEAIVQELRESTGMSKKSAERAFTMAQSVVSDDPLRMFLLGKTTFEDAITRVQGMASKAGIAPEKMFQLLREEVNADLGSYSRAEISLAYMGQEFNVDGNFDYGLVELTGQMKPAQFGQLIGVGEPTFSDQGSVLDPTVDKTLDDMRKFVKDGEPQDAASVKSTGTKKAVRSATTEKTEDRHLSRKERRNQRNLLKEIRGFDRTKLQNVQDTDGIALPGTRGLTTKQHAFLKQLRMEENGMVDLVEPLSKRKGLGQTDTDTAVAKYGGLNDLHRPEIEQHFQDRFGLSVAESKKLMEKVEEWFASAPLTITISGNGHFESGPAPKYGSTYKTAQEIGIKNLDGDEIRELVGADDDAPLDFDALNIVSNTDNTSARGRNYLRWRADKDRIETRNAGFSAREQAVFGAVNVNFNKTHAFEGQAYYGETHLKLKPEVRNRAAFNFNQNWSLRSGPTMLIHEMLHDKAKGEVRNDFIDAIVHNAVGLPGYVATPDLRIELEIFGEVDMLQDVEAVFIPAKQDEGLSDAARTNLTKYFGDNGVSVQTWNKDNFPTEVKTQTPTDLQTFKASVKTAVQQASATDV